MRLSRCAALVILFLAALPSQGQNLECPHQPYEYRWYSNPLDTGWLPNMTAVGNSAIQICIDRWNANLSCTGISASTTTWTSGTLATPVDEDANPSWTATFYGTMETNGSPYQMTRGPISASRRNTVTCPAPPQPECGDGDDYWFLPDVIGPSAEALESAMGGSCYNSCQVSQAKVASPGINCDANGDCSYAMSLKLSGEECAAAPPYEAETPPEDPPEQDPPQGEVCVTSTAGVEYCKADSYGENCGYVNDQYVCLGKTDSDECWVNSDGSRICGEAAPTPPVPDNGTAGEKATPTDSVKDQGPGGTSNTYNYYNSSVVASSSRDPGDSGANPNRPDSYNPSTEPTPVVGAGGEGEGAEGGEAYDPTTPDLAELDSFGDLTQAFWDGLQAAPIVAAWTGIGASVPSGSCPSYSLTVFGQTYSFTEFMCELWEEQVAPILSLVFLFVWPFIGLRIVMSA